MDDSHPATTQANDRATAAGTITLIGGCMFAGKTGELIRMLRSVPADSRIAFRHTIDVRYDAECIVSHDGDRLPAKRVDSAAGILASVTPDTRMVAVEEAHFFKRELVDVVRELSRRGISVALTGLDFDTWGQPIPIMQNLASIAERQRYAARALRPSAAAKRVGRTD